MEVSSGIVATLQCRLYGAIGALVQQTHCYPVSTSSVSIQQIDIGEVPVDRLQRCAAGATHAGDGDDARAPLQVRQALTGNEENPLQVRIALLIPVLKRRLHKRNIGGIDACTVEHMVQPAKLLQDGGYERFHIFLRANIDFLREKRGIWKF